MITEEGIVLKADTDGTAQVKTQRNSACGHCSEKDNCSKLISGIDCSQSAINGIGAKSGDKVLIGIETASLVKLGALLYIFPILGMIAGAAIGQNTAPMVHMETQTFSVILAAVFFTLCFLTVKLYERTTKGSGKLRPHIVKIL